MHVGNAKGVAAIHLYVEVQGSWRSWEAFLGLFIAWGPLGIWRERNNIVFEGESRSCSEVVDSIIREVGSWLIVTKEFKGFLLSRD